MDLKIWDNIVCRITKAFIWDQSQLYNPDIVNFFQKNENIGV